MIRLLLCAVAILFAGCASKNYEYLSADKSIAHSKMLSLITYPQELYFCGPSSLATLLNHQKIEFGYEDIIGSTFIPELKGTLQAQMKATARQYGLIPYRLDPNLASILSEVSNNRPVLVLFNLGLESFPTWHYSIVAGFNKDSKEIYISQAKNSLTRISFDAFETFFERGGSWAVVALKPPMLPVASNEMRTISAINDMAEVGHKTEAKSAALNYVKHYPASFLGSMMLANIHFDTHNYFNATQEYKRALILKPNDAAVLNNLAQSLLKENKLHEAKIYALAAIDAGGIFIIDSLATLDAINKKLHYQ